MAVLLQLCLDLCYAILVFENQMILEFKNGQPLRRILLVTLIDSTSRRPRAW